MLNVEVMKGLTMIRVTNIGEEVLRFESSCGRSFELYHLQDCCEQVYIEDICGDLFDLVGAPLLESEDISGSCEEPLGSDVFGGTYTWTFYKFDTIKGSVTVRWCGTSNGYYSESVDFKETTNG